MNSKLLGLCALLLLASCATKKDILYLQDIDTTKNTEVYYQIATIQPNDILNITVESLVPEAAMPYNRNTTRGMNGQSIQLMQMQGYLVSTDNTISFPVLGTLSTAKKTTQQLENDIRLQLITEGHLSNPSVSVRLLNAKVTILGEVNQPGTFNFTEQNITVLQALGYAGDLTINGKRDDILMTREVDGVRKVTHVDLTSADFMNSEFYFVKPNDVIVVNPNAPRVKKAGFISDVGTVLTMASLALSITILLTR